MPRRHAKHFDDLRALLAAIHDAFTDAAFRDATVEHLAVIRTHIDRLNNTDQDATTLAPPEIKDEQDYDAYDEDEDAEILLKFVEQTLELLENTEQNLLALSPAAHRTRSRAYSERRQPR